jgi:hypothetical protein
VSLVVRKKSEKNVSFMPVGHSGHEAERGGGKQNRIWAIFVGTAQFIDDDSTSLASAANPRIIMYGSIGGCRREREGESESQRAIRFGKMKSTPPTK